MARWIEGVKHECCSCCCIWTAAFATRSGRAGYLPVCAHAERLVPPHSTDFVQLQIFNILSGEWEAASGCQSSDNCHLLPSLYQLEAQDSFDLDVAFELTFTVHTTAYHWGKLDFRASYRFKASLATDVTPVGTQHVFPQLPAPQLMWTTVDTTKQAAISAGQTVVLGLVGFPAPRYCDGECK